MYVAHATVLFINTHILTLYQCPDYIVYSVVTPSFVDYNYKGKHPVHMYSMSLNFQTCHKK